MKYYIIGTRSLQTHTILLLKSHYLRHFHGTTNRERILHCKSADGHVVSYQSSDGRRVMVMSIVLFFNVYFRNIPENVSTAVGPHRVEVSCETSFWSAIK